MQKRSIRTVAVGGAHILIENGDVTVVSGGTVAHVWLSASGFKELGAVFTEEGERLARVERKQRDQMDESCGCKTAGNNPVCSPDPWGQSFDSGSA